MPKPRRKRTPRPRPSGRVELQDWNTPEEVARYFRCSADTIYRHCAATPPRLGHVRIGEGRGMIRIRLSDVRTFEAANERAAEVAP